MNYRIIALSFILMLTTISCTPGIKADLVIINGKILTIDNENPAVEAIAISGENTIAVGTTERISNYVEKDITTVTDAKGRLVIPEFNDAHVHFVPLDPDYFELRYTTGP
jgi:predicted amidohydrolase YtcJ